jgi:hypothetical protein
MVPRTLGKRRYQVSPDIYKIDGKEGQGYRLVARDGTMKTFSRWRLFPVKDTSGYKVGKSFNTKRGRIIRIISGPDKYHRYKVEWEGAGDESIVTDELKRNILTQTTGRDLLEEYQRRHGSRS